jgi:hypothetical protein
MNIEYWNQISGHEWYMASDKGTAKSVKFGKKTILTPQLCRDGYFRVTLRVKNAPKRFLIHRLVAMAFIPNPDNKPCINHKNGIKTDNRVENLEWCTYSENLKHAFANNLACAKGERNSQHKLTELEVTEIKGSSETLKVLSKIYQVSEATISRVKTGKNWKHVTLQTTTASAKL